MRHFRALTTANPLVWLRMEEIANMIGTATNNIIRFQTWWFATLGTSPPQNFHWKVPVGSSQTQQLTDELLQIQTETVSWPLASIICRIVPIIQRIGKVKCIFVNLFNPVISCDYYVCLLAVCRRCNRRITSRQDKSLILMKPFSNSTSSSCKSVQLPGLKEAIGMEHSLEHQPITLR